MADQIQKLASYGVTSDSLGSEYWAKVSDHCAKIVEVPDEDQLRKQIGDAEALFLSLGKGADAELIASAPKLRYIGMLGTGVGRIDLDAARQREITVTNVADYSTQAVAEFVFAACLSKLREMERAAQLAAAGNFDESSFTGTQLSSKSFGILGLGNIGRRVGEIATRGFGVSLSAWSRSEKDISGLPGAVQTPAPEEVIEGSDVLSLHLEHNPETDGFIDADRLALIPDGALVINTAPMELFDLSALESQLDSGRFSFVFDHPDEMDHADAVRLADYESCSAYPPIGYTTEEATEAKKAIFVTNLTTFLSGGQQNVVS